jgi:rod shape-determining protein MreC
MEYAPPPFFRQGPSALARLAAFAALSILLLVLDARFKLLERGRLGVATVLYPLQRAARAPGDAASNASRYAIEQRTLIAENARLKAAQLESAKTNLRSAQLESENTNLRGLLTMKERLPVEAVAAEMLYDARDPFTRKVIIDKGISAGIKGGMVVMDATGVMGQVTRAYPFTAEVSLLTDRNQAIPVQVVRNGLRAIAYGGASEGRAMELRFLAANADVREGDVLVTSGIDGTYLPGLPVAEVVKIEREAGYAFAKIVCTPAAGIDRFGQVLVLTTEVKLPPLPQAEAEAKPVKGKRRRAGAASGAPDSGAGAGSSTGAAGATGGIGVMGSKSEPFGAKPVVK